jgi:transcriptional regulator
MARKKPDLLHGTLELLVLRSLAIVPRHGWAIARHIRELSRDVLEVNQGSLYPALYRLEGKGWIESEWGITSAGRRAKVYSITPKGKRQLKHQESQWQAFSLAVNRVLGTA